MAERERRVRVRAEVVERDLGHWCTDCRLPSGTRAYVAVWLEGRLRLETHVVCVDCSGHNVTLDPDKAS